MTALRRGRASHLILGVACAHPLTVRQLLERLDARHGPALVSLNTAHGATYRHFQRGLLAYAGVSGPAQTFVLTALGEAALDRVLTPLPSRPRARRVPRPQRVRPSSPPELTPRQREILPLLAQGHGNKPIGALLGISPQTVKQHVRALLDKFGLPNRTALVATWRPDDTGESRPCPVPITPEAGPLMGLKSRRPGFEFDDRSARALSPEEIESRRVTPRRPASPEPVLADLRAEESRLVARLAQVRHALDEAARLQEGRSSHDVDARVRALAAPVECQTPNTVPRTQTGQRQR